MSVPGSDRHAWAWSAAIALVTAGALMAYTVWWMPVVHGVHRWNVGGDIWLLTQPGRFVAYGAFGYLYSAVGGFYALPLSAILVAPAVRLADHLHLIEGYPFSVAHPTAWLIVGPWEMLAGVPALHAARRLAAGVGLRGRQLPVLQLWLAATVVVPTLYWGHPEDLLALAFLLYSVEAARQGSVSRASLFLGLAVCSKQWSIVAVPFVLLQAPPGRRRQVLWGALGLPALLAALPLTVDWTDASRALFAPKVPLHLPAGHQSLLLPALVAVFGHHGSILGRVLEVAAAPAVALALRDRSHPLQLAGLGLVLLTRLVLEPVVFPYYVGPALAVLVLAVAVRAGRLPGELMWWSTVLAVWCLLASGRPEWWWSGVGVILLAGARAARVVRPRLGGVMVGPAAQSGAQGPPLLTPPVPPAVAGSSGQRAPSAPARPSSSRSTSPASL